MRVRKPNKERLENGARVSPVETQVIRQIERADDIVRLWAALTLMVDEDGVEWTVVRLAGAAELPRVAVEGVLVRYGLM